MNKQEIILVIQQNLFKKNDDFMIKISIFCRFLLTKCILSLYIKGVAITNKGGIPENEQSRLGC